MSRLIYSDERVMEEALEILRPDSSTYTVANHFQMAQSTVWYHLTHRLYYLDVELFQEVSLVLWRNYKGGGR